MAGTLLDALSSWWVFGVAIAGSLAIGLLLRKLRPYSMGKAIVLAGLVYLVCFVLMQMSSAHRGRASLLSPSA